MNHISFFKLQAKNLLKDFKTKNPVFDEVINDYLNEYSPKFFDIDEIILAWDIDENDFSLMKAQHVIAQMVGFRKWADLLKAASAEQELAKLLFDNQDKIYLEDWDIYISTAENDSNTVFDAGDRLEIFKQIVIKWDSANNPFPDYRIKK